MKIPSSKEKALEQQLITRDEFDDYDIIIRQKLDDEKNVKFDEKLISEAITDFCYNDKICLRKLIKLISVKKYEYSKLENFSYNEL